MFLQSLVGPMEVPIQALWVVLEGHPSLSYLELYELLFVLDGRNLCFETSHLLVVIDDRSVLVAQVEGRSTPNPASYGALAVLPQASSLGSPRLHLRSLAFAQSPGCHCEHSSSGYSTDDDAKLCCSVPGRVARILFSLDAGLLRLP